MTPCVLFDVDGTLADNSHRVHHVHRKPKDWKTFFLGIPEDTAIDPVVDVAMALWDKDHTLLYVTARPKWTEIMTEAWMREYNLAHLWDGSYYRADGDYRPDPLVKKDLLAQIRSDGYDPWLVFDDRDGVVAMWRSEGIPCFQVAPGGF